MPRHTATGEYRPQYIPSFEPTASGAYANNSAQTQAHVHAQNLLAGKDRKPARANEEVHMRRRQDEVDDYLSSAIRPDLVQSKINKIFYRLPRVASPQPVITGLRSQYDAKNLISLRDEQLKSFEGSFLNSQAKIFVYEEIDQAVGMMAKRQKEISFSKKIMMSKAEREKYYFAPLDESISFLNQHFKKEGTPLRVEWRETQEKANLQQKDLYFIFPNSRAQYDSGVHTWAGSRDIVAP